jgi:integrase
VIHRLKKISAFTRDTDFLFADPITGQALDKTMLYKLWREAIFGAGLSEKTPPYTFYSLRHYFASMRLQKGGVDVYALSKIMGTSVKNIEDHYGQILIRDMGDELTRRRRR